ncbi:MAG: ATP synthase F1 subunit epsilon [Mycoplasmatales bacterium]|nr:ATP synthase F1 subunit epsilon [Mycoplasmatales bacterium]
MGNKTLLKIITPHGVLWNKEVDIVTVKTTEGYVGILHGKSPIVSALEIDEIIINKRGTPECVEGAIAGGLLYVTPNTVDIITDAFEEKGKIDIARAERSKRHAEQILKTKQGSVDYELAKRSLKKALNRLSIRNR